ncbi:hypothetical protein NCAS_0E03090 [Naumovozyma castellii]|uniref:Uncharacterized protein n=1 Tax=Naumovozyma castellii TaxID=27288 RepID=G0VFW0_NAUCA|nr:hypothetical protein NCAS_0E03090 [Naumovozyma castellii CBS 4309]CCC70379.1 hypothetical protein NCAS_0E03090 [Naumovozyma castellii CBS 4309]
MDHPSIFLSLALSSGGYLGYQKKGSRMSLIAGIVLGISFAIAAYLIRTFDRTGVKVALYSSLVL